MMVLAASVLAATLLAAHLVTCALTVRRCRVPYRTPAAADLPPISVVQPLRGIETFSSETLQACFDFDYPAYELLFCVAQPNDPIIAEVERIIARNPDRQATVLVGEDVLNDNPKLNNMAKGWRAARHDRIAFIDSNVLPPPDFLRRLMAAWQPDAGVVSAPPQGCRPVGFWSHLECAFLNGHEARWQYAADSVGMGFAQGKTLFFRRSAIGDGGFAALADEPAEDAATTKLVRRIGLRARLAAPSPQPLGHREAHAVWARQLRWARLRRVTFPLEFAPEILTGSVAAAACVAWAAPAFGYPAAPAVFGLLVLWYTVELAMVALCRWPIAVASLPAAVLRDLLIPALWIGAWIGTRVTWHGTELQARPRLLVKSTAGHSA